MFSKFASWYYFLKKCSLPTFHISTAVPAGKVWRIRICRETRFCHIGEETSKPVDLCFITCLVSLPRKQSSNILSDQKQVRSDREAVRRATNLRTAQCICQGVCWCPNFLHLFRAAQFQTLLLLGHSRKHFDDFSLIFLLDTFWIYVFFFVS